MRARQLKHKVVFQEQSELKDDFGQIIPGGDAWTDVLTCRVSINTISGKENYLSNQAYATVSHKIWCRYSALINFRQRIVFENRVFKIIAVLNIKELDKEFEILCEEVPQ